MFVPRWAVARWRIDRTSAHMAIRNAGAKPVATLEPGSRLSYANALGTCDKPIPSGPPHIVAELREPGVDVAKSTLAKCTLLGNRFPRPTLQELVEEPGKERAAADTFINAST